jgi:pyruvate/2-oxoglutarate dehydrogenase complex dihydrolipoamide dehydrogenase (E3) component
MGRYSLIVLGGGSGGLTAAIAALLGARVALLEKSRMGDAYLLRRATPRVRKFLSPVFTWLRRGSC